MFTCMPLIHKKNNIAGLSHAVGSGAGIPLHDAGGKVKKHAFLMLYIYSYFFVLSVLMCYVKLLIDATATPVNKFRVATDAQSTSLLHQFSSLEMTYLGVTN